MTYTNISLMTFTCLDHSSYFPSKVSDSRKLCKPFRPVEISFMLKDDFVEVLLEELVGKIDKKLPATSEYGQANVSVHAGSNFISWVC